MQTLFRNKLTLAILAATLLPLTAQATAPTGRITSMLAAPATGDQTPTRLVTAERMQIPMDHSPVAVSWALPATAALAASPQPYQASSRHYLVNATGAELQRGVDLPVTATGDVVRVSPLGASAAVDSSQVRFASGGRQLDAATASAVIANGAQMQQAGMPVQAGSSVFKLNDSVAAGTTRISAAGAKGNYLIQVFEPASPYALQLAADHGTTLAGGSVQVRVALAKLTAATAHVAAQSAPVALGTVDGMLVAPDGWSENVSFTRGAKGSYVATIAPPAAHAGTRGLWEVRAFARANSGGKQVLREVTTAFAVTLPTARFDGKLSQFAPVAGQDLRVDVGIDVAAASRYAVSAVLYGHDAHGQLHPAVYAQSANWLQPGSDVPLRLDFSASALAKSGLSGPYQLRDLKLEDQLQLGVLERRALAASTLLASP